MYPEAFLLARADIAALQVGTSKLAGALSAATKAAMAHGGEAMFNPRAAVSRCHLHQPHSVTGTVVRAYRPQEATVDVWCSGLFGLTGKGVQEIPIKTSWFTMTVTVRWTHDGWRVSDFSQKDGPEPTSGAAAFGQAPQP